MANTLIQVDETPFAVELRKAAHECGWDEHSEKLLLLRFIASSSRFRPSLLSEFKQFLEGVSKDEVSEILGMPTKPAYHGDVGTGTIAPYATDETEDEDDEEDEDDFDDEDDDFDDEDDDDLDDEEDDLDDDEFDDDEDDLDDDEEDEEDDEDD